MAPTLSSLLVSPIVHRALIVVLTTGVYANALPNGFHLDDHYRVVGNTEIRRLWPPWRHFTDPSTSSSLPRIVQYRPLLPLSLSVDHAIFGLSPVGFHLFAILFHALSALLVYAISRRLLLACRARRTPPAPSAGAADADPARLALVVALLFALHPVSANPVNYICARDLLLTVLGMLLAVWCYLRADDDGEPSRRRRLGWYAAALLAHALALSAKQNAVALPLLLVALELTVLGQRWRGARPWLRALPFALLAVGFFVLTERVLGFSDLGQLRPDRPIGPWGYALSQAELHLVHYLRNIVWPFSMHQDPVLKLPTGLADPGVLAGATVILASLAAALYNLRRRPLLAFAILAYWIMLAPTSSVIPMRRPVVDYRPYPALAFAFLALVPLLGAWIAPRLRTVVAAGTAAYLAACTIWFNTTWRDERTLWQHAVDHGAGSLAHHNLAMSLTRDLARRERLLRRALALAPNNVLAKINLGRTLVARGRVAAGLALLGEATRQAPGWAQTHFWRGLTLVERSRPADALPHLLRAARLQPRNLRYQYQAGRAAQLARRPGASLGPLAEVWRQQPRYEDTGYLYGYALQRRGELARAITVYRTFLAHQPTHVAARFNLAHALLKRRGCAAAEPELRRVLAAQPAHQGARFHLDRCRK